MINFLFQMPRKIEVGFSKSRQLASILKEIGLKKALLVVDNQLKSLGIIDKILVNLQEEHIHYFIFDKINQEPTIAEVDQAVQDFQVGQVYDCVIGIGGGSAIDFAKLLAVSGSFEGSVSQQIGTNQIKKQGVPMIILPTTSGTGAEATPNAIIHDVEDECKKGIVSPYLIPDVVIVDPELTLSLPSKITAETGIDAFTHAIECFICNKATPMSDIVALEAIRLISKYLRQAVSDGNNEKARYHMALASLYGGIAITNSGTGAVHALAYPLGGKYHISHGLSNAVLLADVMEFNAKAVPEKFIVVAEAMGLETANQSQENLVRATVNAIRELVQDVGIKMEKLVITTKIVDDLAQSAMTVQRLLQNNPRKMTLESAKEIYYKSLG